MNQLPSLNELLKDYGDGKKFLPNEVALFSEALVLLSLVAGRYYKGETHKVAQNLGVYTASVQRTSFAAAVLRHMRELLNELEIED